MSETNRAKDLETTGVLAAAALVIGLLTGHKWPYWLALALLCTGLFLKTAASRISSAWMSFAEVLGRINSRIILSAVFYLVLTPVAFLFRLFSGDYLVQARKSGDGSYYHPRGHVYTAGDLEKPW